MCGIAGANLAPDENINIHDLSVALLRGIENRGTHATGVAYFADGRPIVEKADMPASEFVNYIDIPRDASNVLLHTRFGTSGSAKIAANNHPIDVGGVIGIHNGVIYNDRALFERIGSEKRIARVDSEAIFATILHGGEKPQHALARIEGSAAVAWVDSYGDPEVMHIARVKSSPVVFGFTEAGSFIFASTHEALRRGLDAVDLSLSGGPYDMEEGFYMRVRAGEVTARARFETHSRQAAMSQTERRALNLA